MDFFYIDIFYRSGKYILQKREQKKMRNIFRER